MAMKRIRIPTSTLHHPRDTIGKYNRLLQCWHGITDGVGVTDNKKHSGSGCAFCCGFFPVRLTVPSEAVRRYDFLVWCYNTGET